MVDCSLFLILLKDTVKNELNFIGFDKTMSKIPVYRIFSDKPLTVVALYASFWLMHSGFGFMSFGIVMFLSFVSLSIIDKRHMQEKRIITESSVNNAKTLGLLMIPSFFMMELFVRFYTKDLEQATSAATSDSAGGVSADKLEPGMDFLVNLLALASSFTIHMIMLLALISYLLGFVFKINILTCIKEFLSDFNIMNLGSLLSAFFVLLLDEFIDAKDAFYSLLLTYFLLRGLIRFKCYCVNNKPELLSRHI